MGRWRATVAAAANLSPSPANGKCSLCTCLGAIFSQQRSGPAGLERLPRRCLENGVTLPQEVVKEASVAEPRASDSRLPRAVLADLLPAKTIPTYVLQISK
jgi:hypothetical protein